jgi:diguanylate cyclase (GGDEF)-like protein
MAYLIEEFGGISPSLQKISEKLLNYDAILSIVVVDKDGVMHSFSSNEAKNTEILEFDYCPCVKQRIESMQGTFSMLSLRDGDIGIINKQPIVIGDAEFWGNAFIVLKLSTILRDSEFQHFVDRGFDYRLSIDLGESKGSFFVAQSTDKYLKNALELGFDMMSYHWNLAVRPVDGWLIKRNIFLQSLASFLFSILFSFLITASIHWKSQKETLRSVSTTDYLTGVGNRRILEEELKKRMAKQREPFIYSYIDLDNFKGINDYYGHLAGDQILQQTTKRILSTLDSGDFLARVGGDEFVALFEYTDLFQITLNKILEETRQSYVVDGVVIYATLSIGWAVFPKEAKSLSSLTKKADEMMYAMKGVHKQEHPNQ